MKYCTYITFYTTNKDLNKPKSLYKCNQKTVQSVDRYLIGIYKHLGSYNYKNSFRIFIFCIGYFKYEVFLLKMQDFNFLQCGIFTLLQDLNTSSNTAQV